MRASVLLLTLGMLSISRTEAQPNTWVNTGAGSPGRIDALGFSILDKGYVVLGQNDDGDTLVDLFQYDPPSTWTDMAPFPGEKRVAALAFSIADKAYVGMGSGAGGALNDLWSHDPANDTWVQRASLPGAARSMATAFAIGGLGYVSGGADGDGGPLSDVWAYDPALDSWSPRAAGPGAWNASTFVMNDQAYVASTYYAGCSLMRYDPIGDLWTPLAGFEDQFFTSMTGALAFQAGGHGFVTNMGHFDYEGPAGTWYPNRIWEYDPGMDTWSLRNFFPGLPRDNATSFSIDGRSYITTGTHFDPTHTVYVEPGVEYQIDNVRYSLGETWSFDPRDCAGVFNGSTLPGTPCNDGNASTYADALNYYCTCEGSAQAQANFHPDGLDVAFQTGGGFNGTVRAIAVRPDGKIIVAGDFTEFNGVPNNGIARLNADGSLDAGFTGVFGGRALAVQSDGRILVGGAGIHRLMPDGSVDPSFEPGLSGIGTQQVNALVVRPDGRIVAGGAFYFVGDDGNEWFSLAQLLPDGALDPSFIPPGSVYGAVEAILLRPDGRILTGCSGDDMHAINVRMFEENGGWTYPFYDAMRFGFEKPVRALAMRADGDFIAGGEFDRFDNDHWVNDGRPMRHLAQFVEQDLAVDLDPQFNPASSTDGTIYALVAGPGGSIIAGGDFSYYRNVAYSGIVQVNRYGYADAAFQSGSGFNNGVRCFALSPDGSLIVGGLFTAYNGVACGHITRLRTPGPICIPSQLTTTANPVISCGAVNLKFDGSSTIAATEVPGANKYQFRFTNIPGQPAYARNIAWPTRSFTLTQWYTSPLKPGRIYNVTVRASFDNGATWCDWGPSCTVQVGWSPFAPGMVRDMVDAALDAPELEVYPNPTNGDQLRMQVNGLGTEVVSATLDITDLSGRRVMGRTLPLQDGSFNTIIELETGMADGLYIVTITTGGSTLSERLVVAR